MANLNNRLKSPLFGGGELPILEGLSGRKNGLLHVADVHVRNGGQHLYIERENEATSINRQPGFVVAFEGEN